jgi:hypothetical protein
MFTQVSLACFTDCDKWYRCLFIWLLSWENTFNQVIPKKDLGRFYWCISDNYHLCFPGEILLMLLAASFSLQYLNLLTTFSGLLLKWQPVLIPFQVKCELLIFSFIRYVHFTCCLCADSKCTGPLPMVNMSKKGDMHFLRNLIISLMAD